MNENNEYYATHGRGTLQFVRSELLSFSNITILDSIEGKISFRADLSLKELKSLRTVERVFVCFLFEKDVQMSFDKILSSIEGSLKEKRAFFTSKLFKEIFKNDSEIEPFVKKMCLSTKFRINCKLTGKWKLSSSFLTKKTIEDLIIRTVKSFGFNYEIDPDEPDFEIICHLTNAALTLGIPIANKPLSNRDYIKIVGLRSTICSMMLQHCLNRPLTFILDPFCGKATILTEFINNSYQRAFSISSDACHEQITSANQNLSSGDFNLVEANLTKSSGHLPYRDNIFDMIITDLPFEIKHEIQFFNDSKCLKNETFYRSVLIEFNRLLNRETGILVILVNFNEWDVFNSVYSKLRKDGDISLTIETSSKLSLGQTTAQLLKFIQSA